MPGVSKKKMMSLEPRIQKVIGRHVKEYRKVLQEKDRFLAHKDPKESVFGFGGFRKIDDFIRETEGDLEDRLLVLKGVLLELRNSVDRELAINRDFEALSRNSKTDKTLAEQLDRLKSEFADESILIGMVYRQSELIDQVHSLVADITPISKKHPAVSAYCAELDNFCTLLKNTVLDREGKVLELINNLVNLPRILEMNKKKKLEMNKKKKKAVRKR